MFKLQLTGAEVEDNGYGLDIKDVGSLEELISKGLGTLSADGKHRANYEDDGKHGVKRFRSNNCDITVIITPHPKAVSIETDNEEWDNLTEFKEDLEARENEFKEKDAEADPEE